MKFFDIPIGELVSLLTLISAFSTFLMWLFKTLVTSGLKQSLDELSHTIAILKNDLAETKQEKKEMNGKIEELQKTLISHSEKINTLFHRGNDNK